MICQEKGCWCCQDVSEEMAGTRVRSSVMTCRGETASGFQSPVRTCHLLELKTALIFCHDMTQKGHQQLSDGHEGP